MAIKKGITKHRKSGGGWFFQIDGKKIAEAHKTGSYLDDYPWDWFLIASPDSGTTDTLQNAEYKIIDAFEKRMGQK